MIGYAEAIQAEFQKVGIRSTIDRSGERLGKLIRNGEQQKIPVLAVIGIQETEQQSLSLRSRRQGDLGIVSKTNLLAAAQEANHNRNANLTFTA